MPAHGTSNAAAMTSQRTRLNTTTPAPRPRDPITGYTCPAVRVDMPCVRPARYVVHCARSDTHARILERNARARLVRSRVGHASDGGGRFGGGRGYLRGQHFEDMAVRVAEIKTASATPMIDLHIIERAGAAAKSNA